MNKRVKVTSSHQQRLVFVNWGGAWLHLYPEAARALAEDLSKESDLLLNTDRIEQEKKKYAMAYPDETPATIASLDEINEKLSDAEQRVTENVNHHIRRQIEERQEKEWKSMLDDTSVGFKHPNAPYFKKRIEDIEAVSVERRVLKGCEVKAMLKYMPEKAWQAGKVAAPISTEDDDLMAPFDE